MCIRDRCISFITFKHLIIITSNLQYVDIVKGLQYGKLTAANPLHVAFVDYVTSKNNNLTFQMNNSYSHHEKWLIL